MKFEEIEGDLISLAKSGAFDLICHGVNCQNTQKAGIALQMVKAFRTNQFPMELGIRGDWNKLGQIDYEYVYMIDGIAKFGKQLTLADIATNPVTFAVVNCYTQYNYGSNHADGDKAPLDFAALTLCLRKINHIFKGKHIGLPVIGGGLGGGNPILIVKIMKELLTDCDVTIVHYKKS